MKVIVRNENTVLDTYFEVVDYEELPILGLSDCIKLKYNMNNVDEIKKCNSEMNIFIKNN